MRATLIIALMLAACTRFDHECRLACDPNPVASVSINECHCAVGIGIDGGSR